MAVGKLNNKEVEDFVKNGLIYNALLISII